jgi:hypothetical protein
VSGNQSVSAHGDKDFDAYHDDKTRAAADQGGTAWTIASPIIAVVFVTSTTCTRIMPNYCYYSYIIIITIYIYIYIYSVFFSIFSSFIFVRSVSARPVSVGNYSVISVTLVPQPPPPPLLYACDNVIIHTYTYISDGRIFPEKKIIGLSACTRAIT